MIGGKDMTYKEIADRVRDIADKGGLVMHSRLRALANEIDPPRPAPGTVVWWQDVEGLSDFSLGQVNEFGRIEMFGTTTELEFDEVIYKPAHMLAIGEGDTWRQ